MVGKGRSTDKSYRAMQQKIQAGMDVVTEGTHLAQPSKAQLRASVPPYDESMVRRIPTGSKRKKTGP
jgi:hypothetical protein